MIQGLLTALITPFKDGKVDEAAFRRHIKRQIEGGVQGLVPAGTTGESPTLSHDEHNFVIETCIAAAAGHVPVMAGTGSNSTQEAIKLTQHAQAKGADAALVIVPYYNKPTQEGLFQHYKAIHDATSIPIYIYNVPGRTVADISNETIGRLLDLPRIAGIKDATGDLTRPEDLSRYIQGKKRSDNFQQISGEDDTVVEFYQAGGAGVISVTSNIAPKLCREVVDLAVAGDFEKAFEKQKALLPLHHAMFCETSPGPAKFAASLLGLCEDEIRLPLVMPSDENKKLIVSQLQKSGLLLN